MKFNRILDVTDSESDWAQTTSERNTNQMLQYDESDMNQRLMMDNDDDYYEQEPLESLEHDLAIIHPESKELLEEDWKCAEIKVDEIVSDPMENAERSHDLSSSSDSNGSMESMDWYYKPESEQNGNNGNNGNEQLLSDDVVIAMRRSNRDYATLTRAVEE